MNWLGTIQCLVTVGISRGKNGVSTVHTLRVSPQDSGYWMVLGMQ